MLFNHLMMYYYYGIILVNDLPDGIHNDRNPPVLGLGLDPIKIRPNFFQTLYAMLRIRMLRLFRNLQLLYFTIIMPLALVVFGLYMNSIRTVDVKMESLKLNSRKWLKLCKIKVSNSILFLFAFSLFFK